MAVKESYTCEEDFRNHLISTVTSDRIYLQRNEPTVKVGKQIIKIGQPGRPDLIGHVVLPYGSRPLYVECKFPPYTPTGNEVTAEQRDHEQLKWAARLHLDKTCYMCIRTIAGFWEHLERYIRHDAHVCGKDAEMAVAFATHRRNRT